MKKWLWTLRTVMVLFALTINPLVKAETCSFTVRVVDLPPLFFQNELGEWTGIAVDLTKALLDEAGCEYNFVVTPWARSLRLMKTGELDMVLNISMTEKRKEFIHFIGPHLNETTQLILREDINIDIQSLNDFKKLPGEIGYQRKVFLGADFEEKLKTDPDFKSKLSIIYSEDVNLKMFNKGRTIGFITQTYAGISALESLNKSKGFKTHPFIIYQNKVYFGLSRKSVSNELINRLEQSYQTVNAQGGFQRIIDSYK